VLGAADRSGLAAPAADAVDHLVDEAPASAPLVLIVDDEPDMRRFLVSILRGQYRLALAADGKAGLHRAIELVPDCILLDMMLPGMTGLEVLAAIRAQPTLAETRVVMLTARTEEEVKLAALDGGAHDFLMKPFNSSEVRSRIANLLRVLRLQRDLAERNAELETTLARLRAAEAQLVQSEKMNALGSLAAGLLHEINNPLNYCLTAVRLARDLTTGGGDLAEMLDDIRHGMDRIKDIVSALRDFAYPDTAAGQVPTRLGGILDTARRFTAHEMKDVEVVVDLAADRVVCAPTHVSQVLVNLLTNAGKAIAACTDGRRGRITVASRMDNGRTIVTVTDNGIGIPADRIHRIFDPFYTTSEVGRGLGLGLSICHTIITQHGGQITATSEVGVGTTIRFDLPLEPPESPP
jgi:signal transduction histidine kinase